MRLFTKSVLASALVFAATAPALAAPPYYPDPDHRYERRADDRRDWERSHWNRGERFDSRAHYVVVNDYRRYHLRPPPRGQYYYRSDAGQILLIAAATGLIISAFHS